MDELRRVKAAELDEVWQMYQQCISTLNEAGIFQLDENYPSLRTLERACAAQSLFALRDDGQLAGAVILDEQQAAEWSEVHWQLTEGKTLVIHALAIPALQQGRGYGRRLLQSCEAYATTNGYQQIRLDVYSGNPVALSIYEKFNYRKVGFVDFDFKPEGCQRYYCYEKKTAS